MPVQFNCSDPYVPPFERSEAPPETPEIAKRASLRPALVASACLVVAVVAANAVMREHVVKPSSPEIGPVRQHASERIAGKTRAEALSILDGRILSHRLDENCSANGYVVQFGASHFTPVLHECVTRNAYRGLVNRSPQSGLRYFHVVGPDNVVELDPTLTDEGDERYLDIATVLAAFSPEK